MLWKVQWCNLWNEARASHADVGSMVHLTSADGLTGVTLCGKDYPARKGCPGPSRLCKRCLTKAYKQGSARGFTKTLGYVPSTD